MLQPVEILRKIYSLQNRKFRVAIIYAWKRRPKTTVQWFEPQPPPRKVFDADPPITNQVAKRVRIVQRDF